MEVKEKSKFSEKHPKEDLVQLKLNESVSIFNRDAKLTITKAHLKQNILIVQYFNERPTRVIDCKRLNEISRLLRYKLKSEGFENIKKIFLNEDPVFQGSFDVCTRFHHD